MLSCVLRLQLLADIALYKPLNDKWREILDDQQKQTRYKTFHHWHTPVLYKAIRDTTMTKTNIESGFRGAGMWPIQSAEEWLKENKARRKIRSEAEISEVVSC